MKDISWVAVQNVEDIARTGWAREGGKRQTVEKPVAYFKGCGFILQSMRGLESGLQPRFESGKAATVNIESN